MRKNIANGFSIFEMDYSNEILLDIPDFLTEIIYAENFELPPINAYCTESYECVGGQCTVCLTCEQDCKFGCMSNCQTGSSCMSDCQSSSSCQSQGSGCTHIWVSGHHESGASNCSSPSGTSHPHSMHDKCSKCGACRSSGSQASWSEVVKPVSTECWDNIRCSRCNSLIRTQTSHKGYSGATCTSPARCYCGKDTSGSTSPHNFVNGSCSYGCGTVDPNYCTHPNAVWGSWFESNGGCKRNKTCPSSTCGNKIVDTQFNSSHDFVGSGQLQPYSETHHMELGSCRRCLASLGYLRTHSFINGVCACGASSGGGSTNPPVINSMTATSSYDGMSILCQVSATNAVRYVFNLYESFGQQNLILTSGTTTKTSWDFSAVPATKYLVGVDAFNSIGAKIRDSVYVTTNKALPALFSWKIAPQLKGDFNLSITSKEWERLQVTVNAWRAYHNQPLYTFTQVPLTDTSFTIANTGDDFTYIYFNQIINGIKSIPEFTGVLPVKLTSRPRQWIASDFVKFATAVNSFRKS